MTVRPFAAALLAVAALGLAACGGDENEASGSDGEATAQTDQEKVRAAAVKFAQCMREQGIENFPDPAGDGGTRIAVGPESGIDPEEFETASKACEQYREDIRPQLSEGDQQEFKEKALEHARCMREHGIDFPDPQFSGEGRVTMKLEKGKVDPEDPDFKAAQEACGGGGIGLAQPGSKP